MKLLINTNGKFLNYEKKPLITVEQLIEVSLDGNVSKAMKASNVFYTGKELIPLDVECSEEHANACYNLCRSLYFKILIDVFEDGSRKIRLT